VTLEPQVPAHAAALFAVLDDAEVFRYIDAVYRPASELALRERLARLESRRSPDGTEHWLNWVVRNDAGIAVGYVQATVFPSGSAEVAYVIGRRYWRMGYASAAVSAMLLELLGEYGVSRATATLDRDNAASVALLTRLGFQFDSEDGEAHEAIYARALRREVSLSGKRL
jgi:RimJ/RimL family protein N-acetyltransferase